MTQEHLQRMHASATKLMIMHIIPERPASQDTETKERNLYVAEIDYYKSHMHGEALQRLNTLRLKAKKIMGIDGIEERGEGEEEDPKIQNSYGAINLPNMDFMKTDMDGNSLNEKLALSVIESRYLVSVLKNRSVQAEIIKEKQLDIIYKKARSTLKLQMHKLLLKKQFYIIDKQYKLAENEKQTSVNLIKIVSRCIKMFDSQDLIRKILSLIETRLEKL
jgi:hypothetical protein